MNIETLLATFNRFYSRMVENPADLGLLLFMVLVIFFILKKITGNSSRENWYKEKQLKARKQSQEIDQGAEMFLKTRIYSRWFYWSLSTLLVLSLPFSYDYLLEGFDRYSPVLLEHWYVLIGVYIFYRVLIMLNAMMNLKLLSKEIEKSRNTD